MTEQAQALQESERKLTAAARLAHLGYWEIDVVANRVGWSEESARLLGLPPTDRTRSWDEFLQLVYPDDRPRLEECRARIQRGDPAGPVAFRLALPDGTIRYTETAGETVIDENGRPIRTVGAVQDVSGRKRAHDVLRDSEERFQVALQATGLGPWDWDLTTNSVEFWPEWKRQIGYEPHEIANRYEEWETPCTPTIADRCSPRFAITSMAIAPSTRWNSACATRTGPTAGSTREASCCTTPPEVRHT